MTVDVSRALDIHGWMTEAELIWLAEWAQLSHAIIEVGCWVGRSTRALADHTLGRVWAVDTWLGSPGSTDPVNALLAVQGRAAVMELFYANLQDQLDAGRVLVLEENSVEAAAQLLLEYGPTFDMIFIDGTHDYPSVKADLVAYRPLLRPGGLLCGHDIGWPGVRQAVEEVFGSVDLGAGQIWVAPGDPWHG